MSTIQAVLFDKKSFNTKQAENELKKFGLKPIKEVHVTKDKLRYRIHDPKNFKLLRIKHTNKGIEFIFGYP